MVGLPVGLLALILILVLSVWAFRRPIVITLLDRLNESIPGTIVVEGGSLTWQRFFTRLTLALDDAVLIDENDEIVIGAGEIGVSVNPLSLIRHRIDISSLVLSDVNVNIRMYESGRINLLEALGIEASEKESADDIPDRLNKWTADIDNVRLENCRTVLVQSDGTASILLEYLELKLLREIGRGEVKLSLAFSDIRSDGLGPGYFRGKRYELDFEIGVNQGVAVVKKGILDIGGARINISGRSALFYPYEADLILEARGTDTDLLLTFLPPGVKLGDVVPEGNGEISIDAYLGGAIADNPRFGVDIFCRDFGLRHVPTGIVMDKIGFELQARGGGGSTVLDLRELTARLPDGRIHASLSLENPESPLLSMKLDADLNLATIAAFFVFPGSDSITGLVDVDMDVSGRFDSSGNLLEREREYGYVMVSDFRYSWYSDDKSINDLNLLLSLDSGILEIQNLEALTDIGEISLDGSFGDIWPLMLGGDGPLRFTMGFSSPRINPSALFDDPEVASSWDRELEDFSLRFSFDTTVEALRAADPLPEGILQIRELQGRVPITGKVLDSFSGVVEIKDRLRADFIGQLQDSEIHVALVVDGYERLLRSDDPGIVSTRLLIEAPRINGADILPLESISEDSRIGKRLKDVVLDLELIFQNSEWFSSGGSWPEGHWILHKFNGRTGSPDQSFHFSFNLVSENNRADLTGLSVARGRSRFSAHGYLDNLSSLISNDIQQITGNLTLESEYINMSDFIREEHTVDDTQETKNWDIGGRPYPDLTLNLDIYDFFMEPFHWRNIKGNLTMSPDGILDINDISLNGGKGGRLEFSGKADLSREDRFALNADVLLEDLRMEDTTISLKFGDETKSLGTMVKGVLNGRASLETSMNPDLSFDLTGTVMDLKAVLEDGQLIDFPPLAAMADRYRNPKMRNVRLDTLNLKVQFRDNTLELPKTAVGSTLGYLETEGYITLDKFMSFSIVVPNSLIDDVVTRIIFGNRDNGEDEIITAENSSRSRTTVNVVGTPEDILIGIGKRGRSRLEDRWNRRNERRIRREN